MVTGASEVRGHSAVSLVLFRLSAIELAVFDRAGTRIRLEATTAARKLVLTGEPIGEPVVGQGPFVMNTHEEIRQAVRDYQAGRMGHLS